MFQAKADKEEFDIVPYITLCVLDDICGNCISLMLSPLVKILSRNFTMFIHCARRSVLTN